MTILLTPKLEEHTYANFVKSVGPALAEVLPASAQATWDLCEVGDHTGIRLELSDPFGYATDVFSPTDLENITGSRRRFYDLVGEMINPSKRVRIEVRDKFASSQSISALQTRLNLIPDIAKRNLRLVNHAQFSGDPDRILLTEFAIEVDSAAANEVKQALRASGFSLSDDALIDRPGVLDEVRTLVKSHLHDGQPAPKYAICVRILDPQELHLLEVSDDAPEIVDGSLEGIGFDSRNPRLPANSIVIYLASPDQLRAALKLQPSNSIILDLQRRKCVFVHPNDHGQAFYREFPEFEGRPS